MSPSYGANPATAKYMVRVRKPLGMITPAWGKPRMSFTEWRGDSKHNSLAAAAAARRALQLADDTAQIIVMHCGAIVIDVDGKDLTKVPRRGYLTPAAGKVIGRRHDEAGDDGA